MSSPSEFLAFYRRAATSTPRMLRSVQRPTTRSFASSTTCQRDVPNDKIRTESHPDNEHSVNKAKKGDDYDIQSSNAKDGIDSANKTGTGGNATERSDSAGAQSKARKEFPEAPDLIGMQDERGSRGA